MHTQVNRVAQYFAALTSQEDRDFIEGMVYRSYMDQCEAVRIASSIAIRPLLTLVAVASCNPAMAPLLTFGSEISSIQNFLSTVRG
jgi:hypothetical protein